MSDLDSAYEKEALDALQARSQVQPDRNLQYMKDWIRDIPQAKGLSMIGMLKDSALGMIGMLEGVKTGYVSPKAVIDSGLGLGGIRLGAAIAKQGVSGLFRSSRNALGTFFGHISEEAPNYEHLSGTFNDLRQRATEMAYEGTSKGAILRETGLQIAPRGHFVAEVSDRPLELTNRAYDVISGLRYGTTRAPEEGLKYKMGDLLRPSVGTRPLEDIYQWFPELKDIPVSLKTGDTHETGGWANFKQGTDLRSGGEMGLDIPLKHVGGTDALMDDARNAMLHETQHLLSADMNSYYGKYLLSPGSNLQIVAKNMADADRYYHEFKHMSPDKLGPRASMLMQVHTFLREHPLLDEAAKGFSLYTKEPGEVAARTVEKSSRMSVDDLQRSPMSDREAKLGSFALTPMGNAVRLDTSRAGQIDASVGTEWTRRPQKRTPAAPFGKRQGSGSLVDKIL